MPAMRNIILAGLGLGAGVFVGVGAYTFQYAHGFSYMSTDPASCINCHVMQGHYDDWLKSSHHAHATCQDCHLPAEGVMKWVSKADNGWNHSWAFTFQNFHEPIQIKRRNSAILEANCLRCHEALVDTIAHHPTSSGRVETLSCVTCHASAGHGPARSGVPEPILLRRTVP